MWCILFCLNKKYVLVWLAPAVRTANDCVSHIQLQIVIFHFRTKGRPHEPKRMGDLLSVIVNVLHEIKESKQAILYFFFNRVKLISYGIRYWNWIMKYWSKYYNYHAFHLPTDGKDEGLTQRKTTAQQSSSNLLMACACRSPAAPHCQGFSWRWTSAHQSCCRRIRTAGGCCSTPAVGFWGWDTAFLFLSRETIGGAGLCHTWGRIGEGEGTHLALIRWIHKPRCPSSICIESMRPYSSMRARSIHFSLSSLSMNTPGLIKYNWQIASF